MLGSLIDSALDLTVAPGYTRLGYRARRALGWKPLEPGSMSGRRVIITGASAGLGLAAARLLYDLGAEVHILVRDRERGESAAEQIAGGGEREVHVELADLSSLASVRAFASRFSARHRGVHVLINNAGVLAGERDLSVDGHELTFATNVLGMFVLTNELLPQLLSGAPSRVINVSSGGMYTARLDPSDLESEERRLQRPGRLRPQQARPGRAHRAVGRAPARNRDRRARDAPRVGRHPGRRALAAHLPPADRAAAAQPRGRRGHDRMARERSGARAVQRPVLARPARARAPTGCPGRTRARPTGGSCGRPACARAGPTAPAAKRSSPGASPELRAPSGGQRRRQRSDVRAKLGQPQRQPPALGLVDVLECAAARAIEQVVRLLGVLEPGRTSRIRAGAPRRDPDRRRTSSGRRGRSGCGWAGRLRSGARSRPDGRRR